MFKRIKRLLRKRNNGGFTLVEVIVASALLGVLMLGVFGFVQPVLKSVREKEQDARAVMLAETIESYISSSTKYAYYVQTFSGVTHSDVKSLNTATLAPIAKAKYISNKFDLIDEDAKDKEQAEKDAELADKVFVEAEGTLENMIDCMNNVVGTENYEIRCIGMRWLLDPKSGEKKMMLTNETVDQKTGSLDLSKSRLVFEPCFYDGLYPILYFKNYTNQYQILDEGVTLINKYTDEEVKIAAGLEITMDIYLDATCYSTNDTWRSNAGQSFTGTLFTDFRNISSVNTINTAKEYKIHPNAELNSYSAALGKSASEVYNNPEIGNTYYPDTFIYFLARKTKTTGGAGGGTPTPASTSTPESTT